jgi:hypothetical protein
MSNLDKIIEEGRIRKRQHGKEEDKGYVQKT